MCPIAAERVSEAVCDFVAEQRNPALFAGAGVAARAGLPTWYTWMQHLADVAEEHDPLSAKLIRQRAESGQYLGAAAVYRTCSEIPLGERYEGLAAPFRSPVNPERLRALVCLPFSAIFTTNYDRSLHDAFASVHKESPMTVELDDPTMKTAPYKKSFYIARIHGRVEVPETIIFSEEDYSRIERDTHYVDFIHHALTRYSCLFLGFSFADPAISKVFEMVEEQLSPAFPKLHMALLPADTDQRLKDMLARFNVRTLSYDPDDNHSVVWEGIAAASRTFTQAEKKEKPPASFPLDSVRRFLATSYARSKMGQELIPLRDVIVDGIILGILSQNGNVPVTLPQLSARLRRHLPLSTEEADKLIEQRIEHLSRQGWFQRTRDGTLALSGMDKDVFTKDTELLVAGVINRFEVRGGQPVSRPAHRRLLWDVAERSIWATLLSRSWDLGAHYAGATDVEIADLLSTISGSVEMHGSKLTRDYREGLSLACHNLFQRPTTAESEVLAELGRVAFGLQLIANNPCSTIARTVVLPEKVYLDANVMMPAIVDGHPYRPAYADAIRRLADASMQGGRELTVCASMGFVNEVISHRDIALREVHEMRLDNPSQLTRHIRYYGGDNANVFVSAYASWVGRSGKTTSFEEFLAEAAPYENEKQLADYLEQEGIQTSCLQFDSSEARDLYHDTLHALNQAYKMDEKPWWVPKQGVLIDHEARQLTQLAMDLQKGIRAVFVTGDKRLRRAATGPTLGRARHAIMSRRSLVQLIDMLVGLKTDQASLARLLWASEVGDEATMIRDYYIELALQHYDDAMAMSLSQVLDSFVPAVTEAARQQNINLLPSSLAEKSRTARFLDRFEVDFYSTMAEVMSRQDPERYGTVTAVRRERLQELIETTLDLIKESDARLKDTDDPAEEANLRRELSDLHRDLEEYRAELDALPG